MHLRRTAAVSACPPSSTTVMNHRDRHALHLMLLAGQPPHPHLNLPAHKR